MKIFQRTNFLFFNFPSFSPHIPKWAKGWEEARYDSLSLPLYLIFQYLNFFNRRNGDEDAINVFRLVLRNKPESSFFSSWQPLSPPFQNLSVLKVHYNLLHLSPLLSFLQAYIWSRELLVQRFPRIIKSYFEISQIHDTYPELERLENFLLPGVKGMVILLQRFSYPGQRLPACHFGAQLLFE